MKRIKITNDPFYVKLFGGFFFSKLFKGKGTGARAITTSKSRIRFRINDDFPKVVDFEKYKVWAHDIFENNEEWSINHWPDYLFRHEFGHIIQYYKYGFWGFIKRYQFFRNWDKRTLEQEANEYEEFLSGKSPREYRQEIEKYL